MSEVNKFYNPDLDLSFSEKETMRNVVDGKDLKSSQIEGLCAKFFTNRIYATIIEAGQTKDKAMEVAAQVVVNHGEEIQEQLKKNDNLGLENVDEEQSLSNQNQPNTSKDIKKISGGTMAQIITKIAEIMSTMSPEQRASMSQNISALFEVLGSSFDKMATTMQELAKEPIVIASLKDNLAGKSGEKVFGELIEDYLNSAQKEKVDKVSKADLKEYEKEIIQQQKSKVGGLSKNL